MLLIDANVYLLNDDIEMAEKAGVAIDSGVFVTVEILAEVAYVLKGVYKFERGLISETLLGFLEDVYMENKHAIQCALKIFGETTLDFVDCILISYNRILGYDIISFDKKLNKLLNK